jgi:hypothetical protein
MFKTIKDFWRAAFTLPSLTDNVVERTHRATQEVQSSEAAIERARYQRHMALHELAALEAWNHGKVLEHLPEVQR